MEAVNLKSFLAAMDKAAGSCSYLTSLGMGFYSARFTVQADETNTTNDKFLDH